MTREEKIICKEFLNDADKTHSCNEYKLLMALLEQEPQIRPKGHWIWCGGSHKCSNCEEYTCFSHKVRYCPNCGSDNREVVEE